MRPTSTRSATPPVPVNPAPGVGAWGFADMPSGESPDDTFVKKLLELKGNSESWLWIGMPRWRCRRCGGVGADMEVDLNQRVSCGSGEFRVLQDHAYGEVDLVLTTRWPGPWRSLNSSKLPMLLS